LAAAKGITVIIMEPLLGGKLANLPKQALQILKKAKPGSTSTEWALRYIWDEPGATVILSGMNKQAQLDENIATAKAALPGNITKADRKAINDVKAEFNKSYKIPCTGCNYCMPCPKQINIPTCFEAYNSSHSLGRFVGLQQYMTSIGIASAKPHFVSDCVKCGVCVKKCPQGINIPEELVKVRKRLQPPGTVKLMSLFNRKRAKE
jgi:predicted aldo/keto reductase-like oxidoreductase